MTPPALDAQAAATLAAGQVLGLCLAGPTASGKSALAMALANRWPVEIISVDSALVYRGMDIGTAKPTEDERAAVPHHLIDVLDPLQSYSAARFAADAAALAAQIRARGRLPLLVGGTMLYFKALRDGISAMPAANAAVRNQIDAEAALSGWPALHAELVRIDPATAARLAPRDTQRIQRALEVWRSSGRTLSDWHRDDPAFSSTAPQALWPLLALEPQSRAWLHHRIEQRLRQMQSQGLVAEVQRLRERGDLQASLPSMRCVGYRQVWQALELATGQLQAATWFEPALAASRQLAKRQLTWLRSISDRSILPCDMPELEDRASRWVGQALCGA